MYNLLASHHHDAVDESQSSSNAHFNLLITSVCGPELVKAIEQFLKSGLVNNLHPLDLTEVKANEIRARLVDNALITGSTSDFTVSAAYGDLLIALVDHRNMVQSGNSTRNSLCMSLRKIFAKATESGVLTSDQANAFNIRAVSNLDAHLTTNPLRDPLAKVGPDQLSHLQLSRERLVIGNPTLPYNAPGKPSSNISKFQYPESPRRIVTYVSEPDLTKGIVHQPNIVYGNVDTPVIDSTTLVRSKSLDGKEGSDKKERRMKKHMRKVIVSSYSPATASSSSLESSDLLSGYKYQVEDSN